MMCLFRLKIRHLSAFFLQAIQINTNGSSRHLMALVVLREIYLNKSLCFNTITASDNLSHSVSRTLCRNQLHCSSILPFLLETDPPALLTNDMSSFLRYTSSRCHHRVTKFHFRATWFNFKNFMLNLLPAVASV